MKVKSRVENNLRKWMGVEDKSSVKRTDPWGTPKSSLLRSEVMSFTMKVINLSLAQALEGKICNTKSGAEGHQQYVMIYRVEGGG